MAQGERSFLLKEGKLTGGQSLLVELHRAIPVPDKDVPLHDILEFRQKRLDELRRLRAEIDGLYGAVAEAPDQDAELRRCVRQIDTACTDLFKACKAWRNPFRLTAMKASFELRPTALLRDAAYGAVLGQQFGLPGRGATIGAGASVLKFSVDVGLKGKHGTSPYWYAYRFHRDVFNAPG